MSRPGVLACCVLIAGTLEAGAQTDRRGDQPVDALSPQEVQRLFDAYAVVQAQEMLGLSDQQYGPFVSRLKALQDLRREHQQRRSRVLQTLGRLARQSPLAEGELQGGLDELDRLETETAAATKQAYAAIDEVLDLRQRARFRIFEAQLERRKLELLTRARQNRQRPFR